jgi:hypothetical protein
MSNLVPDPENARNLAPSEKFEVLSDFLVKLNENRLFRINPIFIKCLSFFGEQKLILDR